jgi:chromosome segregation ATPase
MTSCYVDGEPAATLLEHRWFAAFKAASDVRAECEALLESLANTQAAWSRARARLSELEALRDALGEELDTMHNVERQSPAGVSNKVMSAA